MQNDLVSPLANANLAMSSASQHLTISPTGSYDLFIDHVIGLTGVSYSGTVTITN